MDTAITIRPASPASVDWRLTSQRETGPNHHFKPNSLKTIDVASALISEDRYKKWHDLVVNSPAQQEWIGVSFNKIV